MLEFIFPNSGTLPWVNLAPVGTDIIYLSSIVNSKFLIGTVSSYKLIVVFSCKDEKTIVSANLNVLIDNAIIVISSKNKFVKCDEIKSVVLTNYLFIHGLNKNLLARNKLLSDFKFRYDDFTLNSKYSINTHKKYTTFWKSSKIIYSDLESSSIVDGTTDILEMGLKLLDNNKWEIQPLHDTNNSRLNLLYNMVLSNFDIVRKE